MISIFETCIEDHVDGTVWTDLKTIAIQNLLNQCTKIVSVSLIKLTCTACQYGAASATGVVATEHPGPKKTILCGGVSIRSSIARIPAQLSH